jgi:hypothetical protein
LCVAVETKETKPVKERKLHNEILLRWLVTRALRWRENSESRMDHD